MFIKQNTQFEKDTIEKLNQIQTQLTDIQEKIFNQPLTENFQIKSSYQLGEIGQQEIIEILNKVFEKYPVIDQSKTGHLGDILVQYGKRKIMFEIKNKIVLTKTDLEKFKQDSQKFDVNFFISLQTPTISSFGEFHAFEENSRLYIYIGKNYLSEQSLYISKYLIDKYFEQTSDCTDQSKKTQLKLQKIYKNWQLKFSEIMKLQLQQRQKQLEIDQISQRLQLELNSINNLFDLEVIEPEELLRQYLTEHSKWKKSDLIQLFPELNLQQYTIEGIKKTFIVESDEES